MLVILALSLLVFVRGCALRPGSNFAGNRFNRVHNAAWISVDWVNQPHSTAEIAALANDLALHQIRYMYANVTYLRADTLEFNPTYTYAADFVQAIKAAQPTLKVLSWIGLPMPSLGGAADLRDPAIRSKVAAISARFVHEMGFDGVQLDPERIASGDQDVIALLNAIRTAIGPGALLSIATEKIQPILSDQPLFGGYLGWSGSYYRQIAQHVDQIAMMTYDTGIQIGWFYRELVRFEVIGITQALKGTQVEVLFGVPASEEATGSHHPTAENVVNGLQGIIDGLNDADAVSAGMSGVAIYPQWEMDAAKWAVYESLWLSRQ